MSQKKIYVTTSLTITWTRIVRLQNNFWYSYYSVFRPLSGGFTLSTSPIQCNCPTLENYRSQKVRKELADTSALPGKDTKLNIVTVFHLQIVADSLRAKYPVDGYRFLINTASS